MSAEALTRGEAETSEIDPEEAPREPSAETFSRISPDADNRGTEAESFPISHPFGPDLASTSMVARPPIRVPYSRSTREAIAWRSISSTVPETSASFPSPFPDSRNRPFPNCPSARKPQRDPEDDSPQCPEAETALALVPGNRISGEDNVPESKWPPLSTEILRSATPVPDIPAVCFLSWAGSFPREVSTAAPHAPAREKSIACAPTVASRRAGSGERGPDTVPTAVTFATSTGISTTKWMRSAGFPSSFPERGTGGRALAASSLALTSAITCGLPTVPEISHSPATFPQASG